MALRALVRLLQQTMRVVVIPTSFLLGLLSLLPVAHGVVGRSTVRHQKPRQRPSFFAGSNTALFCHRPPPPPPPFLTCDPVFHPLTRLRAATTAASAGGSDAVAGSSSSSSSSLLPSTLPSLKILEENQKYFDDNTNNDDEIDCKEWSVVVKKTANDYSEKSSASSSSSSTDDNEWEEESNNVVMMDKIDIGLEIESMDSLSIAMDSLDETNTIESIDDDDDDMDEVANMLMECPPTLRRQVVVRGREESEKAKPSAAMEEILPRPPSSLSKEEAEGEENNKSSQVLFVSEDEIQGKDCEMGENDKSDSARIELIVNTESSQASPSRTYSIDEAYKIFMGGDPAYGVDDDVDAGGVVNDDDTEASNNLPDEYDRRMAEANELIASLRDREINLERELNNGKIRLDEALEAKSRAMTEVDELIASLKNQERIMERELNDRKVQLEEALEGKERVAAEYSYAVNKYIDLKGSMASMVENQTNKLKNDQNIIANAKVEEEKSRGKANLQRLSDEYEGMLSKKSRKIFELRQALRSANDRKRRLQRQLELGTKEIESKLRMGKKERERLIAEITHLTESFGDVQAELAINAKIYSDCIDSYEREAAEKDVRIRVLEDKLSVADEQINQLEHQIAELTSQLEKEQIVSANLTAVVSELQSELNVARINANGYDDIVAILRRESETYQSQLFTARNDTQFYKQKTNDLEELLSKTKDSLISEKKRVLGALEAKDKQIAKLDRDLADKCNEIRASEATIEATAKQLKQMASKFNTEKDRADALDLKIEQLNRLTAANEAATINATTKEVDRLKKLMEEISMSNDEYKSLVSAYDDKVKFLSRQLLLSGQSVSKKQSQIESLRRDLFAATSEERVAAEDKTSTSEEVLMLKAKLDDVQSKSTMWKAQANGMIIQLTNDLREKDAAMLDLQEKLDKLIEIKSENDKEQEQNSSVRRRAQEEEIAQLKSTMEEVQVKAKERMKQKNQSLKEMEDMVKMLTLELEDLKREKDKLNAQLVEQHEQSKRDFEIHEQQLRQAEDRLSKEHLATVSEIEHEMDQTVQQLEKEIDSLKSKITTRSSTSQQGMTQVKEMEEALRRGKEMEVSLINQNMQMKHTIKYLQQQVQERTNTDVASLLLIKDEDDGRNDDWTEKLLPTYYRERQRPRVIQFVGNAWNKLFRRKM